MKKDLTISNIEIETLSEGKQLKEVKLHFGHLINEATKTTQLGLFNFRTFPNIGIIEGGEDE